MPHAWRAVLSNTRERWEGTKAATGCTLVSHWPPTLYFKFLLPSICFSFPPVLESGAKVRANAQLLGRGILVWTRRPRQTAEHSAFHRAGESSYLLRAIRKHTGEQISVLCPKITQGKAFWWVLGQGNQTHYYFTTIREFSSNVWW